MVKVYWAFGAFALFLPLLFKWPWVLVLVVVVATLLWRDKRISDGIRLLVRRDLQVARGAGTVGLLAYLRAWDNKSVSDVFEEVARKYDKKCMHKYQGEEWSFRDIDEYANQVANYFHFKEKFQAGDCVALVATSCPQYIAIWLGLNKIGCVTALINSNLKEQPLLHAVQESKARAVIVSNDLLNSYLAVKDKLSGVHTHLVFNEGQPWFGESHVGFQSFDENLQSMPTTKPDGVKSSGYFGRIVYIYTSGTTGLPKPCIISCHRMVAYIAAHHYLIGIKSSDTLYCTLPLYHSAGGLICVGQAVLYGSTVVIRKSFSASKFWEEINREKCTVFHYVGELCRYLLAQPAKSTDAEHSLRTMYGVGLRPQVWSQFAVRFKVPRIVETYGSTEGNVGLINIDGKPGAIGFLSVFVERIKQQFLIKIDRESGEVLRDERGFCIKCKPGEPGELIGRITHGSKFSQFDGYVQKEATEKKHLRGVLQRGDLFFRTGDILVMDEQRYVYFVDRTGDTFRWKGENVSTTEVEGIISKIVHNVDVAVFGVEVPGCEGRAGMACIAASPNDIDIVKLSNDVKHNLSAFSRPLFLRFVEKLAMTETFKIQKVKYREQGFSPATAGDDLYYLNPKTGVYERLDEKVYQRIVSCQMGY